MKNTEVWFGIHYLFDHITFNIVLICVELTASFFEANQFAFNLYFRVISVIRGSNKVYEQNKLGNHRLWRCNRK